jgi:hypothetical protein
MRRHSSSLRSTNARRPPPPIPALAKQASPEPSERRLEGSLDRVPVADVTHARLGGAVRRELPQCARVLVRIAPPDRNGATRPGERVRHAEPDAAVAAGDDRNPAGEIEIAHAAFSERDPER